MRLFNTGVESPQFRLRGQTPNQPVAADGNRDLVTKTPADFRALIDAQQSIGYVPVNKAGDTMSGALSLPTLNVGHSQVTQGGTAAISEGAEVLLVRAPYLIGEVEIFWNGAANRVERMLIDVSSLIYYDGEVLSITRYVSYQNAGVFGTVRLRQDAGSTMRYLTVTVQNLNGGTVGISVAVRAMTAVAYTFGEALPGGTTVLKSIATPSRSDHLATTGGIRLDALAASRMLSLDANKRVQALDASGSRGLIGAAPVASPAFTGTPTAPTASAGTNTTQIATTAFVRTEVSNLVGAVPGTLDTLDELAAALGDDPNFAASVASSLATKAVGADVNVGTSMEGSPDPFSNRESHDGRGGVRSAYGVGPFSGSALWHNLVDIRHRNGGGDGATGYGGQLAWGMSGSKTRLAFRSRGLTTWDAWTEVWTKAEVSDANMPRLSGNQAWTGQNTFFGDLKLLTNGLNLRSGSGGPGYGSGGFFAVEYQADSEPYNGLAANYSGSATRSSLGIHSNPNVAPSCGISVSSPAEGSTPVFDVIAASSLSLTADLHEVNGANLTMTKMRAKITDATARDVTLPSPTSHSVAIIMVTTSATANFHRAFPPTGAKIFWSNAVGSFEGNPVGSMSGTPPRMTNGMYWFASDGADWHLMSPGVSL